MPGVFLIRSSAAKITTWLTFCAVTIKTTVVYQVNCLPVLPVIFSSCKIKIASVVLSVDLLISFGCSRVTPLAEDSKQRENNELLTISNDGQKTDNSKSTNSNESRPIQLFDGASLQGWEVANFGGEGESHASDGKLTMEMGTPLTGVICVREDLPTNDYEISLEAKREQGIDFFCGLTFPVNEAHCTLIVGGWAGAVVGLSCVDGKDASRNETNSVMNFADDRWYKIRVRVADEKIQCWIDDKRVVDISTVGRKFSLRGDTLITRPLGLCAFETTAAYRKIYLKKLNSAEER